MFHLQPAMLRNGIPCFVTFLNLAMTVIAYPYQRQSQKHIIDMNPETHPSLRYEALKIQVNIGEFMEIACPQHDPATPESETFRFHLFDMHDGDSFESCDFEDKQVVLSCDTPFSPTKLTLKFQKMSPYPLGFTFKEGASYYYTAIPVGEDNCKHAMRLVVDVLKPDIYIPPVEPVVKKTPKVSTSPTASTSTTTVKKTTTSTSKGTITPRRVHQTTSKGNSATLTTPTLPIIALLAVIGSWMNW